MLHTNVGAIASHSIRQPAHARNARRAGDRMRHALCLLGGHSFVLGTEPGRMFLRCAACGHDTPGWHIEVNPSFHSER
jgi:hypothetical protein